MEFSEILLLTINGFSLIVLIILFVLILKIKEDLSRKSMHLEEIVSKQFKQINNEMKALKIELEMQKLDTAKGMEVLRLDIQNAEESLESKIENLEKQTSELHNQLNRLEKLLKEPIDIEEWINESDR